MRDNLKYIINHYGVLNQTKQFNEESYELIESIIDYEYQDIIDKPEKEKKLKKHICEELADCLVMLKQFQEYYEIKSEDIKKVIEYKIDRQLKRIEKEII